MIEPKLQVYDWRSDEFLLIDWYSKLIGSGDMFSTFADDMRYMGNFLMFFRPPRCTLGYAADEKGIFFAAWLEPLMSGAFFGMWVREDKRQSPTALRLAVQVYTDAFSVYTVLIGLCKQEHLREVHLKLGYKRQCTIPALWDGAAVDVYSMTRDEWEKRHGRKESKSARAEASEASVYGDVAAQLQ